MADPVKQTPTSPEVQPKTDQASNQPAEINTSGTDYTKVTDSGNAWQDEAKKVQTAGASQTGGNPASLVNNVDTSADVGTTSDKHLYTFTDEGVVVEASSLDEAIKQLNSNKEGNK